MAQSCPTDINIRIILSMNYIYTVLRRQIADAKYNWQRRGLQEDVYSSRHFVHFAVCRFMALRGPMPEKPAATTYNHGIQDIQHRS